MYQMSSILSFDLETKFIDQKLEILTRLANKYTVTALQHHCWVDVSSKVQNKNTIIKFY